MNFYCHTKVVAHKEMGYGPMYCVIFFYWWPEVMEKISSLRIVINVFKFPDLSRKFGFLEYIL